MKTLLFIQPVLHARDTEGAPDNICSLKCTLGKIITGGRYCPEALIIIRVVTRVPFSALVTLQTLYTPFFART